MTRAALLSALLALALLPAARADDEGCAEGEARITWDSGLMLPALPDILRREQELTLAPNLQTGDLKGVQTCRDFLEKGGARLKPDSLGEWSWRGDGDLSQNFFIRDCLTLAILGRAKPARRDCLKTYRFNRRTPDELPSTLALIGQDSTPEKRGMSEKKSLREWDPGMRYTTDSPTELTAIGRDYNDITLLAAGDFNRDGYQDILVALRHNSRDGGYREWRLAVLSRTDEKAVLSHIDVGDLSSAAR